MFIPAAGFFNGSVIYDDSIVGDLWSSSLCLNTPNSAYRLKVDSDNISISMHTSHRPIGFTIRPVINL